MPMLAVSWSYSTKISSKKALIISTFLLFYLIVYQLFTSF
jgi:hypothetical protein